MNRHTYTGSLIEEVAIAPSSNGYWICGEVADLGDSTLNVDTTAKAVRWTSPSAGGFLSDNYEIKGLQSVVDRHSFRSSVAGKFKICCELSLKLDAANGESVVELALCKKGLYQSDYSSSIIKLTRAHLAREEANDDTYSQIRLFSVVYLEKGVDYCFCVRSENTGDGQVVSNCSGCFVEFFCL